MVPAGGNGNRHRPRGSRAPPRPHRGPAGCYRRRKTGRPRITSPWTCAPHRTGNPRVFELHSPLSAEEFRSLRSKRCSAYARRQTATGQTTGRMRTPKHGGRRRRRAKAGRATTRGANPALHKVPNMSPASWRGGRRNMWRYIPAPGAEAEAQSPEAQEVQEAQETSEDHATTPCVKLKGCPRSPEAALAYACCAGLAPTKSRVAGRELFYDGPPKQGGRAAPRPPGPVVFSGSLWPSGAPGNNPTAKSERVIFVE